MEKDKIMCTKEKINEVKIKYFLHLFGLYSKISYEQFRELKNVAPNLKMKRFEKMKGKINPLTLQYE